MLDVLPVGAILVIAQIFHSLQVLGESHGISSSLDYPN